MKFTSNLLLVIAFAYCNGKTIVIKSAPDPNEKFFDDESFIFSKDVKDNKPPTIFTGDVMKASLTSSLLETKKDRFHNAYGTVNGIEVETVGKLKETETGKAFIVSGSYSYTGADGKRYRVRYTADEFGYHPKTELELDFPEVSTTRKERGPNPESNINKFSNRNNENSKINKPNNDVDVGKTNSDDPNVNGFDVNEGYTYNKPDAPQRLYLPPLIR